MSDPTDPRKAQDWSPGDAPCGWCGGPMPCDCEPVDDVDWLDDAEARNRVDTLADLRGDL